MEEKKLFNLSDLKNQLNKIVQILNKNKLFIFIIVVILTYGYIYLKIETANSISLNSTQIQAITNPLANTRINSQVVQQIQSLQNNSVNVQSLFQNARNNPFND